MKRNLCLLLAAVMLFFTCGCGKNESDTPHMTVNISQDKNGASVTVRDGTEQRCFTVENGKSCEVGVSVEKKDGSLDIIIYRDGDKENCIYRGTDIPNSKFTVTADEPGDYTVLITAHDFTGEYGIELSNASK